MLGDERESKMARAWGRSERTVVQKRTSLKQKNWVRPWPRMRRWAWSCFRWRRQLHLSSDERIRWFRKVPGLPVFIRHHYSIFCFITSGQVRYFREDDEIRAAVEMKRRNSALEITYVYIYIGERERAREQARERERER